MFSSVRNKENKNMNTKENTERSEVDTNKVSIK